MKQIAHLGLRDDVRLLGYLSDDRLLALYHASTVIAFPSLYEGFGLPVLEAMACGVPVVAGRNSSLPEISGDAALLLSDHDLSAWVSAISSILEDAVLAGRLASSGIAQAQLFSWDETSRLTLAAYRRVLGLSSSAGQLNTGHPFTRARAAGAP
jgi:glycosyltransferase involved in cell wall biosynthesis